MCLLLSKVNCWARRRRLTYGYNSLYGQAVNGSTPKVKATKIDVCGYRLSNKCCSKPSFGDCSGLSLIGATAKTYFYSYKSEEACELRAAKYGGKSACIPENLAEMLTIADNSTHSRCFPTYFSWCNNVLDEEKRYYASITVPIEKAALTNIQLLKEGHYCYREGEENIKCHL